MRRAPAELQRSLRIQPRRSCRHPIRRRAVELHPTSNAALWRPLAVIQRAYEEGDRQTQTHFRRVLHAGGMYRGVPEFEAPQPSVPRCRGFSPPDAWAFSRRSSPGQPSGIVVVRYSDYRSSSLANRCPDATTLLASLATRDLTSPSTTVQMADGFKPLTARGSRLAIGNNLKWPLARVKALYPGPDGLNRVATIRTATTKLKRPLTKLIVLPMNDNAAAHQLHPCKSPQLKSFHGGRRSLSRTTLSHLHYTTLHIT